MFFNNIKNDARPDAKCGDIICRRKYISGRQYLLLKEVKGINRVSANKNESLLTFMQNHIL